MMIDVNCSDFLGQWWIAWKERKGTFRVMEMLYVLIGVMFTPAYASVKTHQSVNLMGAFYCL